MLYETLCQLRTGIVSVDVTFFFQLLNTALWIGIIIFCVHFFKKRKMRQQNVDAKLKQLEDEVNQLKLQSKE